MYTDVRADVDLSQEQELRGMVTKSLSSLEIFDSVSEQHCLTMLLA